MTKVNLTSKDIQTITVDNKADIINTIVSAYFQENENGENEYTPYLAPVGKTIAIAKYLIEGLEFDKNERIYEAVINDDEVISIVNNILISKEFKTIMDTVTDIIEYKKRENIARIQNEFTSIIAYKMLELIENEQEKTKKDIETTENLNQWINEQREINSLITPEMQRDFAEKFNPESLTDAIIKKYSESDLYKKNQEVVEANRQIREKNNKIVEMESKLIRKEQEENVKNILAD